MISAWQGRSVVALLAVVAGACGQDGVTPVSNCRPSEGVVTKVRDGDTIELDDGTAVRFLLVDTPELSSADCFAEEAYQFTSDLLLGQTVQLEYDGEQCTDAFSRNLAYVYWRGHNVNRALLERGYARLMVVSQQGRVVPYIHQDEFTAVEAQAQDESAGLWGVCW